MRYTDIISKLINISVVPSFLVKLNLWSFTNIKFFFHSANSVLFYFLTNLQIKKIRYIKINNYSTVYFYMLSLLLLVVFLCFLI